jgi:hypothetical protein
VGLITVVLFTFVLFPLDTLGLVTLVVLFVLLGIAINRRSPT